MNTFIQYDVGDPEKFESEKKVLDWDAKHVVEQRYLVQPIMHIAGYNHNNVPSAITWETEIVREWNLVMKI